MKKADELQKRGEDAVTLEFISFCSLLLRMLKNGDVSGAIEELEAITKKQK